jgi:hypothetical protein
MPQQQYTTQDYMAQGVYNALSLSVFAQALGLMVAAGGFAVAPVEMSVSDPAVKELRKAYGDSLVSKAIEDVGTDDAISLAIRVEHYVHEDLIKKYGEWAANIAIEAAPPGDLRTAREIAQSLSSRGVTQTSSAVEKVHAVAAGKMRGRSKAEPVRDTQTGIQYQSKYAAGKAVAHEYGMDPTNTHVWYQIVKTDPNRFVSI